VIDGYSARFKFDIVERMACLAACRVKDFNGRRHHLRPDPVSEYYRDCKFHFLSFSLFIAKGTP
jgi:hypothetical protein